MSRLLCMVALAGCASATGDGPDAAASGGTGGLGGAGGVGASVGGGRGPGDVGGEGAAGGSGGAGGTGGGGSGAAGAGSGGGSGGGGSGAAGAGPGGGSGGGGSGAAGAGPGGGSGGGIDGGPGGVRLDAGVPVDAAAPPLPDAGPPREPPVCRWPVEVVFYTASDWNRLTDALAADASRCASFFVSIPAPANAKTEVRPDVLERMRARGPQFKAMAEFHWGGWSRVNGMSWYEKGVEFRRRMVAAGYDAARGETWAINELPSSVRSQDETRIAVRDAVRGLFEGPAGSMPIKGAVFVINMGHPTVNFNVYKPNIQDWLQDRRFWEAVNLHVRWWAQEVYVDPLSICVDGETVGARSQRINAFTMHVPRLAGVGPDSVNTAQSYLSRAYVPLMTAVWGSDGPYGRTQIPLEQMQHHVSGQVHAARAWAEEHRYPAGRLGFAWDRGENPPEAVDALAARLASALHHAYDEGADGGRASGACSPNHAFTWCQCAVAGARFNEGWETFGAW